MRVIALVANKGGVGKTTLSINLASALQSMGGKTLLVDADPQGSSLQWKDIAGTNSEVDVADGSENLADVVAQAKDDYQFCVIDCPPSVQSPQTREVLRVTEFALVPVQPSPLDLWASVHIEGEVDEALAENSKLKAKLIINQMEPHTRLSQLVKNALGELNLAAVETAIRRRVAYRNAVLEGRSVLEMGSRGRDAAEEIKQLINELGIL